MTGIELFGYLGQADCGCYGDRSGSNGGASRRIGYWYFAHAKQSGIIAATLTGGIMASLHYKFAAMNSGKSTQLIQAHFNYCERGMVPYAMTPAIDDRYGVGVITARVGLELSADVFTATSDLFDIVQQRIKEQILDVFIVDEAQFLTRTQVYQLARIVDELNIPVIAYGLKSDFRGELFEGSYHLLCLADKVEELKSICWCGNKAHMNARVAGNGCVLRDGNQVEIGGHDKYVSLCRKHYLQGLAYKPAG